MHIRKNLKSLWNKEKPLSDIWEYFIGNYRYKIYYGSNIIRKVFIRKHILEQIKYRMLWMDRDCYSNGSCVICGCQTTNLQMANKQCDKPCYPPMLDRDTWIKFKNNKQISLDNWNTVWLKNRITGQPELYNWNQSNQGYVQDK